MRAREPQAGWRLLSWRWVVALLALALPAPASYAQVTTGELSGTIVAQGTVLPGVTVEAFNEQTGFRRVTVSNESGSFRILGLQPGLYTVKAELSGFATRTRRSVPIGVGQSMSLTIDFGGPVPIVEDGDYGGGGFSAGSSGPTPSPSPSPSRPPRCQVVRESFSDDIRLTNWLLGRKGGAIVSIIGSGVGSSLFVQCPRLGPNDPSYVVVPVSEAVDPTRLQDRINQHETLVFVGVHQLSEASYAMVLRRDGK